MLQQQLGDIAITKKKADSYKKKNLRMFKCDPTHKPLFEIFLFPRHEKTDKNPLKQHSKQRLKKNSPSTKSSHTNRNSSYKKNIPNYAKISSSHDYPVSTHPISKIQMGNQRENRQEDQQA